MPTTFTKEEIAQRGREIYDREIRPKVESDNTGRFLVVDVLTNRVVGRLSDWVRFKAGGMIVCVTAAHFMSISAVTPITTQAIAVPISTPRIVSRMASPHQPRERSR